MGQTILFNLFQPFSAAQQKLILSQELIPNEHEPLNALDPPMPATANYYKSDDHIYHYINNQWKRSPLSSFTN
jgi:hypothetical protein